MRLNELYIPMELVKKYYEDNGYLVPCKYRLIIEAAERYAQDRTIEIKEELEAYNNTFPTPPEAKPLYEKYVKALHKYYHEYILEFSAVNNIGLDKFDNGCEMHKALMEWCEEGEK